MTRNSSRHPLSVAFPAVRFPVTICVLAYGPNVQLAERFLTSLYACTDARLFSLRAGLNEAAPATQRLFRDYAANFNNISIFDEPKNVFKYPIMRRMFYETTLATDWTIWCDDDSHFTRPDWLQRLAFKIESSPEVTMWGKAYVLWRRDRFILNWIKAATWYRGLLCLRGKDLNGKNALKFSFATGGFWAIRTDILRQLNWPDPRLVHVTGDFLLGEALRQNCLAIGHFDYGVKINDAPRRNSRQAVAVSPGA
jgi:GT2 family glycosyltransferase